LHEGEHCIATRAALAHQRVVTKLLLIICDCRISAISSLQKRHTLGDNAGWEIFIRAAVSTARLSHPGATLDFRSKKKLYAERLMWKATTRTWFSASSSSHGRVVSNQFHRRSLAAGTRQVSLKYVS
jgi:hypothetical protein